MITGKTKIIGILGWPVDHSLSPTMHNEAFAALALDYCYIPLPVPPTHLQQAVEGIKSMGFIGVNVTIPHKVTIMPYLDELDSSAKLVGAVNTIVIKNGKCIGYNTDAQGFIQSLLAKNITIKDKTAVIMGAGGASRAVVAGLIQHGIANIMIGARNVTKGQEFIKKFPDYHHLQSCDWQAEIFSNAIKECDLLINCTPVGMEVSHNASLPVNWQDVRPTVAVCDLIYNPPLTPFLIAAKQRGHVIINGAGMLIEQGALAFELWTGQQAPRHIMHAMITKSF